MFLEIELEMPDILIPIWSGDTSIAAYSDFVRYFFITFRYARRWCRSDVYSRRRERIGALKYSVRRGWVQLLQNREETRNPSVQSALYSA